MKKIKILLSAVVMIMAINSVTQAKQLWGLMTEFRTEDLAKINAWAQVGNKGNAWIIIERSTGDIESGYIAGIFDTENPEIKKVGFLYVKTCNYKVDYNDINFYAFNLTDYRLPCISSIGLNYHPFPIDMDYKD